MSIEWSCRYCSANVEIPDGARVDGDSQIAVFVLHVNGAEVHRCEPDWSRPDIAFPEPPDLETDEAYIKWYVDDEGGHNTDVDHAITAIERGERELRDRMARIWLVTTLFGVEYWAVEDPQGTSCYEAAELPTIEDALARHATCE